MNQSEITIVGAGPAGVTAAAKLATMGIPSLLLDKEMFPRPKVCGDGLSGKVISMMKRLDPSYIDSLLSSGTATGSSGVRFYSPKAQLLELKYKSDGSGIPPGLICKRMQFDHFFLDKALSLHSIIRFEGGRRITTIERTPEGLALKDDNSRTITETRILLFAGGFNPGLLRQLDPAIVRVENEGIGVRGYFANVTGCSSSYEIEIHFLKELLPGYLWIFPFLDGSANVGLGLPYSRAKKKPFSLKELLFDLIGSYPHLKGRFRDAKPQGKIEAGRIPFYNGPMKVAGHNYLLLGDAARLVDPFTGEGIGNAMVSGSHAADTVLACLEKKDFSLAVTKNYQESIYKKLKPELDLSLKMQNLAHQQMLINLVVSRSSGNEKARQLISEMLYSHSAKSKLKKPLFYLKLLLGV